MATVTIDKKEIALSPLSFEDVAMIEEEAAAACNRKALQAVERLDYLRLGTVEDRLAILKTAAGMIADGDAEEQFSRTFSGQSFILWLSARKIVPEMTLAEFRQKCSFREAGKFNELIAKPKAKEQPVRPEKKFEQVEDQEDRRTRIFNAICETEKLSPLELKNLDTPRQVELFCKYGAIPSGGGCDPEKLKMRIEEYVAKAG